MNGSRYRFNFTYSPSFSGQHPDSTDNLWGIDFKTLSADARTYFHIGRDYTLALRGAGAVSWGEHPQTFFLGGVSGWINRRFEGGIRVDIDDVYFSGFATPLRGADYYARFGDRYLLTNAEFRFPLIRRLQFGWPLPFFFYNIRGAVFADAGAAWREGNFRGVIETPEGHSTFGSIAMGYGWGARVGLGFALLKFDMAWRNDLYRVTRPRYYFSLGFDL
jgi:outer membrane protein assembly factor BamA